MKIYDFDVEDEILKVETNLQNVEILKNSFADYTAEYRKLSQDVYIEFRILSDCIESYERALLIGVYTYAEQLVKNFYYELLEKDRAHKIYINNFINIKLDPEKFSPNVKYELLETGIKKELFSEFKFVIRKEREEILKYDDIIKDRHRYAHRGIYQSNFEQYRDVINAEKYITLELEMIVNSGREYRIEYQDDWKEIGNLIKVCCGLHEKFIDNSHQELKRKLVQNMHLLKNKSKKFLIKYSAYIDNCFLLEEVKIKLQRVAIMDLRKNSEFSKIEELNTAIKNCKLFFA